jgi:ectoine hydroxylase-related dioxygenase (phytanoyl-CoA dioxygenase family)
MRHYREEGYVLVKRLFDERWRNGIGQWLSKMASQRDSYAKGRFILEPGNEHAEPPLAQIRKINALHQEPECSAFFGGESPAVRIAAQIIASGELRMNCASFTKPALNGSATPWHQDQTLWHLWTPTAVSCWVAIDECTVENGCLEFVRGSHRHGVEEHILVDAAQPYIPDERVPQENVVPLLMEPGDAVFFHGLTWHASKPNRSPHRRLSIVAVYYADEEYQRAKHNAAWYAFRSGAGLPTGLSKSSERPLVRMSGASIKSY